jgi:hypothetical protein
VYSTDISFHIFLYSNNFLLNKTTNHTNIDIPRRRPINNNLLKINILIRPVIVKKRDIIVEENINIVN